MQISNVRTSIAAISDEWCGTTPKPLPKPKGSNPFGDLSSIFNRIFGGTVPKKPLPDPSPLFDKLSAVALNPQPLPPEPPPYLDRLSKVSLNPQPLPPGPPPELGQLSFRFQLR